MKRLLLDLFERLFAVPSLPAVVLFYLLLSFDAQAAQPEPPEARWGLRALSLRPSLGGFMLDFRYKVVDAQKALPLFDKKIKPFLLDEASGVGLGMPEDTKLGALRASPRNPPVAGKQYYVFFANSFGSVKRGSKVTVVIGGCRFHDVVVE